MSHLVTLTAGAKNIVMPNGLRYGPNAQVLLSDQQYSELSASFKSSLLAADVIQGTLAPQATTATNFPSGYALVNGTGTIFSWTPPNDGQLHHFLLDLFLLVTSNTTGGDISLTFWDPADFSAHTEIILGGTQSVGPHGTTLQGYSNIPVPGGKPVTLAQTSAMTAGAATLWADLLGS
jgi:hypothetical protein